MSDLIGDLPDFSLVSDTVSFEPEYYPERVKPSRERNIKREDKICAGENINDNGAKNHDLHIRGYLLESEKNTFWEVLDAGDEFSLIAMPWSGFVYIKSGNLEGPKGIDNREREWVYEYTIKVVGAGDRSKESQTGILSDGPTDDTNHSTDRTAENPFGMNS